MLVGPPASGKTALRRRLVARGLPAGQVVSLDDLRRAVAAEVEANGGPVRAPQAWTLAALHRAAARREALLAAGLGYLADATHLRRRERLQHVRAARAARLVAVAVLLPELPVEVLLARDAGRPEPERVPEEVLLRHAHRRSLLSSGLLRDEGFGTVVEVTDGSADEAAGRIAEAVRAAPGRTGPS